MGRPLLGAVDNVHDLGRAEGAEREPEVERCTDDHDHVGLLHEAAGAGEGELVVGG